MLYSLLSFAAVCSVSAEVYFEDSFSAGMDKCDIASPSAAAPRACHAACCRSDAGPRWRRWVEGFPSGKEMGKWVVTPGKWFVDEEADKGMAVSEDMRFHSISAKMDKPSSSKGKDIVVQFSAKCALPTPPLHGRDAFRERRVKRRPMPRGECGLMVCSR